MFSTLRNYSKIIVIIIAVAMIATGALMGFGAYGNRSTPTNVPKSYIAKVNDTEIAREDFLAALRNQAAQASQLSRSQLIPFRARVLESMIEREVILQQADELGIESSITDQDIEDTLADILEQNEMTEEELISNLAEQDYSLAQLKNDLRINMDTNDIIQQTVEKSYSNVNITEEEVKEAYQELESEKDFAEMQEQLKDNLLKQKQNTAFQNWLESVKAETAITITDPTLSGYKALMNSNFEKAVNDFNNAIENNSFPSLYIYLAESYNGMEETEKAVESFEKAVEEYPEDWELRFSYGDFYAGADEEEKALKQYDKASELAGEDFMAHYRLYLAYSRMEATEKAEAEMEIINDLQQNMQQQQEEIEQNQENSEQNGEEGE